MKFNTVSRNRVSASILLAAFCSTTVCAQEQEKREDRFTPRVAGSGWTKKDPATDGVMQSATLLREKLLEDPHRPTYHFCMPENGAGDPNGCFYANGRYHFMYLHNPFDLGATWGHASSHDLVHWRHHPDAILPGPDDELGAYSGGAFIDEDGIAYLSYWLKPGPDGKGVGIARSVDAEFDKWVKLQPNPLIKATHRGYYDHTDENGKRVCFGTDDPTNIWKKDGRYYMAMGNKFLIRAFGVERDKRTPRPNAPQEFLGDHLYLFESTDLHQWTYKGEFYDRRTDNSWTGPPDDNACPVFLPLPSNRRGGEPSGKHALIFLSHITGNHYYVGTYDKKNDKFIPESHGKMCWANSNVSAPEAMIDDRGRFILWVWPNAGREREMEAGWAGVYSMPQTVWLGTDNQLRRAPVEELEVLRTHRQQWKNTTLADGQRMKLDGVKGDTCELEINVPVGPTARRFGAKRFGVKVRTSPGEEEVTLVYYDATKKKLCFDARRSSSGETEKYVRILEEAPLELKPNEPLKLRVFVDRAVVEIFANDRQAIIRRIFPARADSVDVVLYSEGGETNFVDVKAWKMQPSNPF
jgi:beta-fructofuranosidase